MMERQQQASRLDQLITAVACGAAIFSLALGASRAVQATLADWHFREGDLANIESAERLMPSDARYHFARAQAVQQADPTSAEVGRELAEAVALNPRFSEAMLSWSVDKEFSGDKRGAEDLLQRAQRIDRLLRPSWALANFYYRQDDSVHFWPEARECLRMIGVFGFTTGRYDPNPVFRLCWSMDDDGEAILSKAIPPSPQIEQIYLGYLLKNGKTDAEVALASRMLSRVTGYDVPILISQINALISEGQIETAVREWDVLIDRKLLPYRRLDAANGSSLTNGSFQVAPYGTGFDWRPLYPESVHFSFVESEHTYRFDFDGTEPQQVDLLSQTVPLLANRSYQLRSRYRAGFDAAKSGVNWTVSVNHNLIPARIEQVSGSDDKTLILEFRTPAQAAAGNLQLSYSRQPGTTLIQGPLELLQTALKLL